VRQKSGMTSKRNHEFGRGINEQRAAIADLQRRWPVAFPTDPRQVRPLAGAIIPVIVAEFGWSVDYTKGVLCVWKQRRAYCSAVLRYDLRRDLNGAPTGTEVDDAARTMAKGQLDALNAQQQKRTAQGAEGAKEAPAIPTLEPTASADLSVNTTPTPSAPRRRPVLTLASMRGASPAPA
jgi:sRNA-binding protein